jgi:hypothetical protein
VPLCACAAVPIIATVQKSAIALSCEFKHVCIGFKAPCCPWF